MTEIKINSNIKYETNSNLLTKNKNDNDHKEIKSYDVNQDRNVEDLIKLNKSNKRKNIDVVDMRMSTRRGKFSSPMENVPNISISETVLLPLQPSFETNQKINYKQSMVDEKLHENHPQRELKKEITPFSFKLKPVSEFLSSLISTSTSPKNQNEIESHDCNSYQYQYQSQSQSQNDNGNLEFRQINGSKGKEKKKIPAIKTKKNLKEKENESLESTFCENISKQNYQSRNSKSVKYENKSNYRDDTFEKNEKVSNEDLFSLSSKLSFSQSSSDSENFSSETKHLSKKLNSSTTTVDMKSKIKLIENPSIKNEQIIQQRKMKAMKIVYPYFGSEVAQVPKIVALRCLEYLEGTDFYSVSVMNNLWCKTALDPALWEDSVN